MDIVTEYHQHSIAGIQRLDLNVYIGNLATMTWLTELTNLRSWTVELNCESWAVETLLDIRSWWLPTELFAQGRSQNPTSQVKRTTLYWTVERSMRGEADSSIACNRPLWQSRVKTDWCFDLVWRFEFEKLRKRRRRRKREDWWFDSTDRTVDDLERRSLQLRRQRNPRQRSREMFQSSSSGRLFRV